MNERVKDRGWETQIPPDYIWINFGTDREYHAVVFIPPGDRPGGPFVGCQVVDSDWTPGVVLGLLEEAKRRGERVCVACNDRADAERMAEVVTKACPDYRRITIEQAHNWDRTQ